jgi:hypothetical protein
MKGSKFLLCFSLCLLLALLTVTADAFTCPNGGKPGVIMTTYYPPGPDGTIYVESSPPGAVIYINEENKGHAPVTITNLWPGTYTITAELAGYEDFTTITTISGPTRSSVYCPMVAELTGNGLYILSTPPRANVYIDGVSKGVTPLMIRNPPAGPHEIQVRLSGYAEWKLTANAPSGGTRTITAVLNETDGDVFRGINVTSNPEGARIILDGLEKGVTPKELKNIAAGIHILELEYPGYKSWKSTIDVPEAQIKQIPVNLIPKPENAPGWISVVSSPANASVTLDGNYVGKTPTDTSLNLDAITPGQHTIVVSLPGYKSNSTPVNVSPNLISTVNIILVPVSGSQAKGALLITSDPSGATLLIDNQTPGITPFSTSDITAGNHEVVLRMDGYQDYSTSFLVSAGATRTVSATLLPVSTSLHSPVFPLTAFAALGIMGFFILRKKR